MMPLFPSSLGTTHAGQNCGENDGIIHWWSGGKTEIYRLQGLRLILDADWEGQVDEKCGELR
jgi:hypothetical protein